MKNVDIFLNTGIFSRSVANRINLYDWSKVKNFPKITRKKSLSSCYGYIDLIEVKIFAARERGVLSLRDQQCSYSANLQNILEIYKDRAQSTSIWHKIGNFKISLNFFCRPMMSNVVIFDSIDSKGLFKDVWHNYTHFKYRIGVLLGLFWYIVSNYLKWHFLEYSVDQIS